MNPTESLATSPEDLIRSRIGQEWDGGCSLSPEEATQAIAAIASLREEVARFHSERPYIIGHNDGWRDALRQEVFAGTVDTDNPLEAAAREAGWALMELVDEIDFRKREEVSEIAARLGKALLAVSEEQDELAKARAALAAVANWINTLPIPTTGATRVLGIVLDAQAAQSIKPSDAILALLDDTPNSKGSDHE